MRVETPTEKSACSALRWSATYCTLSIATFMAGDKVRSGSFSTLSDRADLDFGILHFRADGLLLVRDGGPWTRGGGLAPSPDVASSWMQQYWMLLERSRVLARADS